MPVQVHAEILVNQSVPRSEIDLEPTPHILEAPLLALSVHMMRVRATRRISDLDVTLGEA